MSPTHSSCWSSVQSEVQLPEHLNLESHGDFKLNRKNLLLYLYIISSPLTLKVAFLPRSLLRFTGGVIKLSKSETWESADDAPSL